MAGASRNRKSRRRQLKTSHQKNWLVGRYAVLESLRAAKWPADEIFLAEDLDQASAAEVRQLADRNAVPVQNVTSERLTELCHAEHHQGLAARMGVYPYDSLDILLNHINSRAPSDITPLVAVCDRIQDTFNFGAILRCCDSLGVTAVVISDKEQTLVSPQVARSSAGAVNHVSIVLVDDLEKAAEALQKNGFLIAAASEKSDDIAWDVRLERPVALVIGSEAKGVSPELQERCETHLRIPMMGSVESLNAAVAAGILLYEIRRQQSATAES